MHEHLKRDRKTPIEGAKVMWFGRLFHIRAAETGKARSPTVDSGVRPTINDVAILHNSNNRRALGFVRRSLYFSLALYAASARLTASGVRTQK